MLRWLIRYFSYPLLMALVAGSVIAMHLRGAPLWPGATLLALAGAGIVGAFERLVPYERDWLYSRGDLGADLWHNLVNLTLIQIVSFIMFQWTDSAPWQLWPRDWPFWVQLLVVALIVDLSLYFMHRVSHRFMWLWKLHAIHHSPGRLYWLNGERRHPLHAVILAAPALVVLAVLAAPQELIAIWFTVLTVHLAFQHANLDYTIGPMNGWLGVATLHRWHHKRDFEDAQVNYGEFLLLWDRLFGTYYDAPVRGQSGALGLREGDAFPRSYWGQLRWPFGSPREPEATGMLGTRPVDFK